MSFMLALPKISLHGAGAIGDMVKLVAGKQWGKALIVTDGQLVKLGLLDSLFAALDEQQMAYQLFDEVFPNPTEALVQQGYAAYQAARCDYLIAFGGGSPIDTAKAIKILTANPGPSTAYSGVGKVKNAGVPLVAINTTAGTAAEMTSNAVIIDSERQVKEVIIDPNLIPDIAVDDASVMLDIPPAVTAATGMDALTHAIEAFVSVGAHPLTDANALEAIRLINLWLPKAVDDGHDLQAASRWPLASIWRAWRSTAPVSGWYMPWPISLAPPIICRTGYATPSCCRSSKTLTARTRWRALPAWRRRWASILAA
ncbi:lactaldehyde dehydrogenase [Klebsiella pneumoniae subsp. pneumoniae]|uniref:Lactaldehyde dehydrogenase n=1 Tax=Klebsiella pneumoniae subsp. pneumoniae TaxID=72407 RepID=A0A378AUH5_KLEPN|nr:lactaldehyde dehydrogenase [Klebsiella pneumoniae subsp. pneumoniae]